MGFDDLRRLLWATVFALVLDLAAVVSVVALGTGGGKDQASGPHIGDHLHAALSTFVCGKKQKNIRVFEDPQGIHTHGDGIIHLHPFNSAGENSGASLGSFFKYGGGRLSNGELLMPGQPRIYGYTVSDCNGQSARLRVLRGDSGIHPLSGGTADANFGDAISTCDGMDESEFEAVDANYIPQDGDCIRIVFGP